MMYFFYSHNIDYCEVGDADPTEINLLGRAKLNNYKLTFRFFPDVEPAKGHCVEGFLFYINDKHDEIIKESELCPNLYTIRNRELSGENGLGLIRGNFFTQKFTKQLPNPEYLSNLYSLYLQYGLPLNQINEALTLNNVAF